MKNATLLALALLCAGCTTTAPTRPLKEVSRDLQVQTGVVIPVQFQSTHAYIGQSGCELVVRPVGGLTLMKEIHASPGRNLVFVQLDPGTYAFRELRCGEASADLTFSAFPLFSVYGGKVSVAGPVKIQLGKTAGLKMKVGSLNSSVVQAVQQEWDPDHTKPVLFSAASGEALNR